MTEQPEMTVSTDMVLETPKKREAHMIEKRRWNVLRQRVQDLGKHERTFASGSWAFVGIALSGLVALVTWTPAYWGMTAEMKASFTWVWVTLVTLTLGGAGVAVALFVANGALSTRKTESVESVIHEMDLLVE